MERKPREKSLEIIKMVKKGNKHFGKLTKRIPGGP